MTQELYTLMLLETSALAALVLISFLLYRAHPQAWLKRWNIAWTLYLIHMPLSFMEHHAAREIHVAQFIATFSDAIVIGSMAVLSGRAQWERRIWIFFGALELLSIAALLNPTAFDVLGLISMLAMVGAGIFLSGIYALSRRTAGGWLLLLSFPMRLTHWLRVDYLPVHFFETLAAGFALVAGLFVILEELRESRLWRTAALTFSSAMAAGGGAGEIDALCYAIGKVSGADMVRLLEDEPDDTVKRRSAILPPAQASLARGLKEMSPKGVLHLPLMSGEQRMGTLVLGFRRALPGPPGDMAMMREICGQIGVTLRGSQLTAHLMRSHREWLETVDSIRDFILVHSLDGRIERVNRPLAEYSGHSPADLVGRLCRDVLPGAGERWQQCPFCEASGAGEKFNPDFGGYFLISTSRSTATGSMLHVVRDISARKAAEERYRYIFENVREGVFISTPEGHLVDCNDGLARMLGYTREELLRVQLGSMVWLRESDRSDQVKIMDRQGYLEDYQVRLRKKTGEELIGMETSFATRNPNGKVVSYQGFIVDVTERNRAEEELKRQNEILSEVNRLGQQMTHRLNRQVVLDTVVQQIRRLFRFEVVSVHLIDEASGVCTRVAHSGLVTHEGLNMAPFLSPQSAIDSLRRAQKPLLAAANLSTMDPELAAMVSAERLHAIFAMPLVGEHLLGTIMLANRCERQLTEAEENLLGALGRQVNNVLSNTILYEQSTQAYEDLRLAQEQLIQTQKLAAVGQLVSGVAHELNNPLAAIIGYSQLLATHVSPKGADYLEKMMRQAKRTQKIIQDLLTFSRQRKPDRHVLDLNNVVDGALTLREFDISASNVRVVRQLGPELPPIMGDRHQLEQAFLNIINNACDAIMETGVMGTIEVRSYLSGVRGREHVVVEFLDDGVGMKEPSRVFEPFYTTKKVGMGTGLGLSICYGILKEHGGEIEAEGRQPHGSVFRVKLPASREAEETTTTASATG